MAIILKSITLENFKGCKNKTYKFGLLTRIFGANASGKTTIFDALAWLLFNKDSLGSEKFSIRPLEKDGTTIHNVEIKVSAVFDVDGREMEFTKVQKEKWVKKRGADTAELQGNENLYEVDGYPRTEKDYKAAISDLVSEDLFKMLTNPTYFPSLKWKDQRDILMRFVSDVSDYELAKDKPEFAELLLELQKAPSTDDIKNKYQKSLNEWKKKQTEIPVRIDESEKSRVVIDVAELELGKKAVQKLIDSNLQKQEELNGNSKDYDGISSELMELQFKKSEFVRKANESLISEKRKLSDAISELARKISISKKRIEQCKNDILFAKERKTTATAKLDAIRDEWNTVKNSHFEENLQFCHACGQTLPEDKIAENKKKFEENKQFELARITQRGNFLKNSVDEETNTISKLEEEILFIESEIKINETTQSELNKKLSEFATSVDVSENEEYKEILRQIAEKEEQLRVRPDVSETRRFLAEEERKLRSEMAEFDRKIASADNSAIDERIAELQAEQREVAQKVADMEKMVYLLESFIRYKMDVISESINGKFDGISWKLFNRQVNGGISETCECTVDGVPYSSCNNGHRIVAGLKIIKALQELYGVSAPIFIDNAESVNEFNLPAMDCQLILLTVSDDKELRVEV